MPDIYKHALAQSKPESLPTKPATPYVYALLPCFIADQIIARNLSLLQAVSSRMTTENALALSGRSDSEVKSRMLVEAQLITNQLTQNTILTKKQKPPS
jgi:hypothetical protein